MPVNFGSVQQGQTGPTITFSIQNAGAQTLTLGTIAVPTGYTLTQSPPASLAPGGQGTFAVQLASASVGTKTGQINIANNDPSNPFAFPVAGAVTTTMTLAQIQVAVGVNTIANGQSSPVNFGNVQQGEAGPTVTFPINNVGGQTLTLGTVTVPSGYTVTQNPAASLAPGEQGTLIVQLSSVSLGTKTGGITVANNDPANNPFSFQVSGAVTTTATPPQIQVATGLNTIANGQSTPLVFGSVEQGQPGPTLTFVINNVGGQDLTLGTVTVPTGYTLKQNPPTSLVPGEQGALVVQLDSLSSGTKSGEIIIGNSDTNNNPFAFEVTGTVTTLPQQLTGATMTTTGEFVFTLHGPAGSNYLVQVSSNLVNWLPFSMNTIPASGLLIITDSSVTNQPRRFYRAVLVNGQSVGTVIAWGDNTYGQTNVPPDLANATSISAGFYHSLALKADGTVVGWGQNTSGETNVPASLSSVTSVAAGWGASLALKRDGTLEEWGWDGGYGLKATAESLTNIKAIAACWDCLMALRNDGTVFVWGKSTHGETNVPAGLTDVVAVSGGGYFCMALKGDGTVVTWGSNAYGQTNIPANLSGVKAIAAGGDHCLALKSDGTVVVWGYNNYGQTNVPPDLTDAVAVSAGAYHSLALRADGTLVAWGLGSSGQTNIPPGLHGVAAISAGGYHNLALVGNGLHWMKLVNMSRGQNGSVQFSVSGVPGDTYRVLASSNLVNWQTIGSVANVTGTAQFIDTAATNYSRRYYRCVMP
jgi:alpha-tubulin suppressor-like RCC1 family protein